jgi:hypothetical protein
MYPAIKMAFGGLSKACYFRHFLFGLVLFGLPLSAGWAATIYYSPKEAPLEALIILCLTGFPYFAVSTLLYPYSRFVYEGVVGFIMGNNVFFLRMGDFFLLKGATMAFCFLLAILIAPIGLVYLYFRQNRAEHVAMTPTISS